MSSVFESEMALIVGSILIEPISWANIGFMKFVKDIVDEE